MRTSLLIFSLFMTFFWGTAQATDAKLLDILQRYQATQSSTLHPEGLQTLILKGTYDDSGKKLKITTTRKAPNKLRYEFELDGIKTIIAHNGEIGWQRREKGDLLSIRDYVAGDFDWLKLNANFQTYLLRVLAGEPGITLSLLEDVEEDGRVLHVILVSTDSKFKMKYFLNSVSFYLERLDVLSPDGILLEGTVYSDYRKIEGISLAHQKQTTKASGEILTYNWDTIEVNPTVYSFVFEKPKF